MQAEAAEADDIVFAQILTQINRVAHQQAAGILLDEDPYVELVC